MAGLALLDGTNANIDFAIASAGAGATATASLKCSFAFLSARIVREFTEQTTFCSSGWRSRNPGFMQLLMHLDGYASKGTPLSSPMALFTDNLARPFVFTADTSCTFSGSAHAAADGIGLRAAGNSDRGIDLESYGAVTVAWVVA